MATLPIKTAANQWEAWAARQLTFDFDAPQIGKTYMPTLSPAVLVLDEIYKITADEPNHYDPDFMAAAMSEIHRLVVEFFYSEDGV